jgi:transposase
MTNELWSIDGTLVRAHRCAAGAGETGGPEEPSDHALGRSRGGFGTKAHLVVDAAGLPLHVHLTGGQVHEARAFDQVAEDLEALMSTVRPMFVAGDKAYGSKRIRDWLIERNVTPVIPTKSNERRDADFPKDVYRRRNIIERCIGWLKEFRRVATRYEKLASRFLCMLKLAGILLWLRAGA